jgi:hypothetical protein
VAGATTLSKLLKWWALLVNTAMVIKGIVVEVVAIECV